MPRKASIATGPHDGAPNPSLTGEETEAQGAEVVLLEAISSGWEARPGLGPRVPDPPNRARPLPSASLGEQRHGTLYWRVAEKAQLEPSGPWPGSLLPGFFQASLRRPGHLSTPPGMSCVGDSSCTR